jgi:hypothetical protein
MGENLNPEILMMLDGKAFHQLRITIYELRISLALP